MYNHVKLKHKKYNEKTQNKIYPTAAFSVKPRNQKSLMSTHSTGSVYRLKHLIYCITASILFFCHWKPFKY